MGLFDKASAKALEKMSKSIDVDALVEAINNKILNDLKTLGHEPRQAWSGVDWTYDCAGCDFEASGNRGGDAGIDATTKMAEVHLGELNRGQR